MNDRRKSSRLTSRLRHEHGQVLPMTALMMAVLIGFAGLVIDVGRVWIAQSQLQNAVDAAAAIAGQDMPNSQTAYNDAVSYNGFNTPLTSAGKNALTGYEVSSTADPSAKQFSVTFKCLTDTSDISSCGTDSSDNNWAPSGSFVNPAQCQLNSANQPVCNAVTVSETATVKTTFAHLFLPSFTVTASSTASAPSQAITPIDVAVVVDTTGSMGDPAGNNVCPSVNRPDKLDCVKAGIQTLLQTLYPCNPGSACSGDNQPLDKAELLVFPGLTSTNLRAREEDCTQNLQNPLGNFKEYDDDRNKTVNPFTSEGYTYTVVPWESSFSSWNAGQNKFVLNANDPLVKAVQTGNCGLEPGGNTSFSSVLQAAQDSLNTLGNDGATHAIIFLGDGDANYGPIYTSPNEPPASPDRHTPCQQAVNVAQQATAAGTTIYSIGYWEGNGDQTQQCLGMINQNGCRYGMTSAQMTQQFGNGCAEPNLTGATWPAAPACPNLPRGADVIAGCWTMYNIASDPADFFPDASNQSLTNIFKQIGQNLGKTRLINSP